MQAFRTGSLMAALLLPLAPLVACGGDLAPSVTPAELHQQRASDEAPVVIDVRTPEEFAQGHIPGAINIAYDTVAQRIGEIDTPHGVALYCQVGPRARRGEAALLESGYDRVLHLDGGFAAWRAAGLPVATGP